MIIELNAVAQAIGRRAAERFTERYEGQKNRWVYDKGQDYHRNNLMGLFGEIAAGVAMGSEHFPSAEHLPYDFVANGWRVDVKTTEGSTLQVRRGHSYKLDRCDVLALVRFQGQDYLEFVGWMWSDEFKVKGEWKDAKRTEESLQLHRRKLLSPNHWRYLGTCTSKHPDAKGPPWPGGRGPLSPPNPPEDEWVKVLENVTTHW